jgi:ferredoxin
MNVTVIEEQCTGCGICPGICPEIFELEGAVASVNKNPVPDSCKEECIEAAASCPVEAITISGA